MRVVFADGEEERVLRAVEVLLDERLARPILIGRPEVVRARIERLGLHFSAERDVELCNPESDPLTTTTSRTTSSAWAGAG